MRYPFPRTFRALRNPNYRLYWVGQIVSMLGTWMQTVAQAWLVLRLTDSPVALGVIVACQTVPVLLFALFGGVVADRVSKRRLLVWTQSAMLVQAAATAALTATNHATLPALYLLAFVLGTATAFDNPVRQAFTKELVASEDVPNAVALNSIVMNVARLAGPALAGLTIAALGVTACFALNALSFLAVIGALLRMRPERFFAVPPPSGGRMLAQIAEAVTYARRTPEIGPILLLTAVFGIFAYQFNVVLPLIARYVLHYGPVGFGALSSAMAVGSLVGALRIAHRGVATPRMLFAGAAGFSVFWMAVALSTRGAATVPLLALAGMCSITYFTTSTSRVQLLVAPALRGRVMGLYALLDLGTAPIGSLLVGALAAQYGVRPAVGIFGAMCALGTAAAWRYLRSQRASHPAALPDSAEEDGLRV